MKNTFLFFILSILKVDILSVCGWYSLNTSLPRRDGKYVGCVEDVQLELQQKHQIKTLSLKPLLFEIQNFLQPEECDHLIHLAKNSGLNESLTHPEYVYYETTYSKFREWDVNNDSFIDPQEFTYIKGKGELYLTEVEIMEMINDLKIDENVDGRMDYEEFLNTTAERIYHYFYDLYRLRPSLRSRRSKQAWLWHYGAYNNLLERFHDRISRLTLLPRKVIETSEPVQVVHYEEGGHYHCHHDSDEIEQSLPCCTHRNQLKSQCRLCRYLTVMFFLNNVKDGGETAFPVANNASFSHGYWEQEAPLKCNLIDNCYNSNLVFKPLKGTALLWYNHLTDKDGWLGDLDATSYHGGCEVNNGEKWIANTWINIVGTRGSKESLDGWLEFELETKREEL